MFKQNNLKANLTRANGHLRMELCQWHTDYASQPKITVQVGNKSPVFSHYED